MRKTNEMFKSLVVAPVKITNDNPTTTGERDTNGASLHKNLYALSDNNFQQLHLSNIQMTASSLLPQPSIVFYEKNSPITIHNNQNNLKSSQYITSVAASSSSNSYDGGSLQMNALQQYQDNNTKYQTPFSQNNNIIAHYSERPKPNLTKDNILNSTNNLESNIPKDMTKIDPTTYLQNPDSGKIGFQNLIIPRFITNMNPLDTMNAFQSPRSPKFTKKGTNLPEDNHTAFFNNPATDSTIVGIEPNEKYQSPQNSLIFGSPTFKKVTSSKPIMKKILSRPPSFEEIPDDLGAVVAKSSTAIENDFEILSNRLKGDAVNEEASHKLEKKIGMVESSEGFPVINIRKPIFDRNYKPGLESNFQKQKLESAQKIIDEISSNSNKKQRKYY